MLYSRLKDSTHRIQNLFKVYITILVIFLTYQIYLEFQFLYTYDEHLGQINGFHYPIPFSYSLIYFVTLILTVLTLFTLLEYKTLAWYIFILIIPFLLVALLHQEYQYLEKGLTFYLFKERTYNLIELCTLFSFWIILNIKPIITKFNISLQAQFAFNLIGFIIVTILFIKFSY